MRTEMTPAALVELMQLFESAGIEVWLEGGWGVDALLGRQTRPHKDLDIILRVSDLPKLRETLTRKSFSIQEGGTPSNFVLADVAGREVDVHAVDFDRDGNGVYRTPDGLDWMFPAVGFTGRGTVDGLSVRCLTPEIQVYCHGPWYVATGNDIRDMELLRERFGVELPPHLERGGQGPESTGPEAANLGLVRPPLVYLGAIALGVVIHLLWPVHLVPRSLGTPVGATLTLGAVALFLSAARTFRAAGTPLPGNRPATTIVRTGPYRFSRNPIYLAFSLLQLGLAFWVNSLGLLLTLMPAIALMSFVVIPREEKYLAARFPSEYAPYKASVRRWL